MKSIFRTSLIPVALLCLAVTPARAASTINWGTPYDSVLLDSKGNFLDPALYQFELGAFVSGFTPQQSNLLDWRANWRVFDVGSFSIFDDQFNVISDSSIASYGYITGTAEINSNGTSASQKSGVSSEFDFRGLDAFVWGYNQTSYSDGLEWVLLRSSQWTFPGGGEVDPDNCCPLTLPLDWSSTDLRYEGFNHVSTDVAAFGSHTGPDANGLGERSFIPGQSGEGGALEINAYEFQTFTIPEPATAVVGLLLAAGILRRQRKG